MESKQITILLLLAQGIGFVFYAVFSAAYFLPLPSNDTLIGDPVFRSALSIFGGIFVISILVFLVFSALHRKKD